MRSRRWSWAAALAVTTLLGTGGVARASTITVSDTGDPTDGACPTACSLRHAVDAAGADDTVVLPAGTYKLTQGRPIAISGPVTLTGAGVGATTIDGSGNRDVDGKLNRILTVFDGGTLQLSHATLTGGSDEADETCFDTDCYKLSPTGGGALFNAEGGTADLQDVQLAGNRAPVGGAVSSAGTLALTDVDMHDDGARFGGGLFVRSGSADIRRSAFHALGRDAYGGGAVFVYTGTVDVHDSTISDNGSGVLPGGGLENRGGTVNLVGVTFSGNDRGAIMTDSQGRTTAWNTIIAAGPSTGGDWACVPVGEFTGSDDTTDRAITVSFGHNVDQDGHCLLSTANNHVGVDPKLAPLADNDGPTPTAALLHGSPALAAGDPVGCSPTDQRGTPRPAVGCDIGAFEAVRTGAPTATTDPVTDVTMHGATLHATLDLKGEAGGAHFLIGKSLDALAPTAVTAAGRSSTVSYDATGLDPNTTYYVDAVADNATGAGTGETRTFTTAASPPVVSDVSVESLDDTTATIVFKIDPAGAPTSYVIAYGDTGGADPYDHTTAPVQLAGTAPSTERHTLTGLDPDSVYHFTVIAKNSGALDGVDSGDSEFATQEQQLATAGQTFTFTDSGDAGGCPTAVIDWGDDTAFTQAEVHCVQAGEGSQDFTVSAAHVYATKGHFAIHVNYDRFGEDLVWALVAAAKHSLSVASDGNGSGTITGDGGIDCPGACAASLDEGTPVTLTAHPAAGSLFTGWSGAGCAGTGPCALTLGGDRAVTATFALAPPAVSDVSVVETTDTTAKVHFSLDPGGAATHFAVAYGPTDDYGSTSPDQLAAAASGAHGYDVTLSGLTPGSTYRYTVRALSAVTPDAVTGGKHSLNTAQQIAGSAGTPITLHDSSSAAACPTASIDWGDGGASEAGQVACEDNGHRGATYVLTAGHAYPRPDHYRILIDYGDFQAVQYAQIGPPQYRTLTVTTSGAPGTVTGTSIDCPGACEATYVRGTRVTLTAHPSGGAVFKGWGGACSGTDLTCAVELGQDAAVSAAFESRPAGTNPEPALTVPATPIPTPPAPPTGHVSASATYHATVVASRVSGKPLFRRKGARTFSPLASALSLPLGAQLDSTHGKISLLSVPAPRAATQRAVFSGGLARVAQPGGITELALAGKRPACKAKSKPLSLSADAQGAFRISGRFATATTTSPRDTRWQVQDTCSATLVRVTRGRVSVTDLVRHKTILVRAGNTYRAH